MYSAAETLRKDYKLTVDAQRPERIVSPWEPGRITTFNGWNVKHWFLD